MQLSPYLIGAAMSLRSSLRLGVCALTLLAGCDRLGLPDPAKEAAAKEADGRATGGACRHSGRALEDCYVLNPEASRSAVYAGWKEMSDYMRENKIETVKPEKVDAEAHAKMEAGASASASAPSASASASDSASESASAKGKSAKH